MTARLTVYAAAVSEQHYLVDAIPGRRTSSIRHVGDDGERSHVNGPWVRHSRTVAYENPWITVFHDEVTRPDGLPGIYGVVHLRVRAVGVVALDQADRVLLVGQHRYTLDRYSWECPAGGSAIDGDPLLGARRELEEETGYRGGTWRELIRFTMLHSVTDHEGVFYVATDLEPGQAAPDGTEALTTRWVPFAEALKMIDGGEIHDAMTQIALLAVARERSAP
jgi:8-oxo-dGTP pyrophosphatase MutT (NUDIX family)